LKTQQAHSRGRDATLRRTRIPRWRDAVPTIWLNLVCLDAPLVAIAWLWLFARTFQVPVQLGNAVALFLTAWLIYLGDRLADTLALKPNSPRSLRQQFCLGHREIWIATVALVAGFDAYVILGAVASETFVAGAVVGVLALIYLVVNHPLGRVWRSLPAKELVIGILFAAGTVVALLPRLPQLNAAFAVAAVAFATLCALNCISIAGWERQLDLAQGKVSVATRHPSVARNLSKICVLLTASSMAMAIVDRATAPLFGCIALSALLLAWLNQSFSLSVCPDRRTALADLVLLTPIVVLAL
jgi:hypothetical protein